MIDLCTLGTGGTMPLPDRALASLYVRVGGRAVLVDCGEGTQIGIQRLSWGIQCIDAILLTHYHADHCSGLPGMLLAITKAGRTAPLHIYGPIGLERIVSGLRVIAPSLSCPIVLHEIIDDYSPFAAIGLTITPFPLRHEMPCIGYQFHLPRPALFDPIRARAQEIPVKLWSILQRGETVSMDGQTYYPHQVLGQPRTGITAVSMPGFGTTHRTKSNAESLARDLGVSFREVSIHTAVEQHFKDIEHDPAVQDVTYENSQARERTQILMDLANQAGGFVIGTGDLSELALGWATYNGDHMSMYAVNASVPKTLVRHLVRYAADVFGGRIAEVLLDILDTPVSPELLPPTGDGEIAQKTEDLVGPYELHDYFLYYLLRFGFEPGKIYRMALKSFEGVYDAKTVHTWLRTFYRRFFAQQFKRSCLPDGPKVGSVTLSPRGDWRMPSDASSRLWLARIDALNPID